MAIAFRVIPVGIVIASGVGKIDGGSQNVRACVHGGSVSAMNEFARGDAAADHQDDAVNERGENAAISKIQQRRGIEHDEFVFLGGFANQPGHVFGRKQIRRIRRDRAAGQHGESDGSWMGQQRLRQSGLPVRKLTRPEVFGMPKKL